MEKNMERSSSTISPQEQAQIFFPHTLIVKSRHDESPSPLQSCKQHYILQIHFRYWSRLLSFCSKKCLINPGMTQHLENTNTTLASKYSTVF